MSKPEIREKLINTFQKLQFFVTNRIILFFLLLSIFFISYYLYSGSFFPSTETKDIWFYSGLFMVVFSIFFVEPYYTSPKNVITNVIPLLLVFLSIKSSFPNTVFWNISFIVIITLLIISITAMALENKNISPDHINNKIADCLKKIVVIVGRGRVLYSCIFIYFLLTYFSIQNTYTFVLFLFWFFVMMIDPKYIHNELLIKKHVKDSNQIGEIFGVQSKKMFLVKLFKDKNNVKNFDVVKFQYSMQKSDTQTIIGIVFDTYFLNKEKWAKVLELKNISSKLEKLDKNIVYKISNKTKKRTLNEIIKANKFVGVIINGSTIGKIKFEYSKKKDDLQEGDLLELNISNKTLFYQVINGTTEKEKLESKNETGFINGEAIQLGEWNNSLLSFQKFGWVPQINTPVFKANTSNINVNSFEYPLYKLGNIQGTSLPSVIDLDQAISCHLALIGVTGSGKSFLAKEIINQIKTDTKVICIDFNREFVSTLTPPPQNIISDTKAQEISQKIDWINVELDKFSNQQDRSQILLKQNEIKTTIKNEIKLFFDDQESSIKIFELPDVSNTTGILDYTKYFFRMLFEVAKEKQNENNPIKLCVVLEEAHTIIPEWTFSGSNDKTSQALVNSIGQIALQGRKYGVGFLVIAQRTANVSKTVLTQCNTVICFQAFDDTSFSFLSNYVGKDLAQTLPNLKQYHAVVAGKAVKSNMPMIIDLTRS